jgi:hypothetical protein
MKCWRAAILILMALVLGAMPLAAQTTWQEEFAKMPLTTNVAVLNRHNCVQLMLGSFKQNPAVKALIFMPGATDEFYFFHRARATLTNNAPTLLDAVVALTNQTYIRVTLNPPFLLMHTDEDSIEPIIVIHDQRTAERIMKKHFQRRGLFYDRDWDYMQPLLDFYLDTKIRPGQYTHDTDHFFRHSFSEYDLGGWDALRAVALAGKTCFTVERKKVVFFGDVRVKPPAVPPSPDFLYDKNGD